MMLKRVSIFGNLILPPPIPLRSGQVGGSGGLSSGFYGKNDYELNFSSKISINETHDESTKNLKPRQIAPAGMAKEARNIDTRSSGTLFVQAMVYGRKW